jgi:hypothetical protein
MAACSDNEQLDFKLSGKFDDASHRMPGAPADAKRPDGQPLGGVPSSPGYCQGLLFGDELS